MTDDAAQHPMAIVTALMEERQRYESWLTTLEGRRESTPPHVYERVHADYGARLAGVMNQLAGRTTELRSAADSLRARIDRLQGDENAKRDERAEAELRAAVGEFAPDRWNALRDASEGEIDQLARERSELSEEQARLEELLRLAVAPREETPPAPVAPPPVPPRPAAEAAPVAPPVAAPPARQEPPRDRQPAAAAAAPAPPTNSSGSASRAFDELAFLKSVTDGRDSGRTAKPDAGAASDAPAPRSSGAFSAPTPMPAATEPRPRAMTPAMGQGMPRVPTPSAPSAVPLAEAPQARSTAPARRMPTPPEPTRAAPEPVRQAPPPPPQPATRSARAEEAARAETAARENIPSFLRDVPNEQVKTLKCQECGTMNYPTEWYCERCGGELASM